VLKLLELYEYIEGVIYCDYSQEGFACKPEREFYDAALDIVGLTDPGRCYFIDDSKLNITAARKLGWGHCVLFETATPSHNGSIHSNVMKMDTNQKDKQPEAIINYDGSTTITDLLQLRSVWKHLFV
jgi:pyrimidine and pyridine-specific 5'-nucleotidase